MNWILYPINGYICRDDGYYGYAVCIIGCLQSAGVTSPYTRSTTAASDSTSKDSSLDENDLYIKYKKLQKQLEFLQVEISVVFDELQ